MRWNTVAIVGVGLIGGSVGLALRTRKLARQVVGIGRNADSLSRALDAGAVTEVCTDLASGVAEADVVVVATPIELIVEQCRAAARSCPPGAIITDAGSTKRTIAEALGADLGRGVRFLGSHPIAGSEKKGPQHAQADLFVDRVVVLTPTLDSSQEDRQRLTVFWQELGAHVREMSPALHDQALAATSHLPHVVAAVLAEVVPEQFLPLSAGGLRDTTRIAAGDAELWRQILLDNRDAVLAALEQFAGALTQFKQLLELGDAAGVSRFLSKAKKKRDALGS